MKKFPIQKIIETKDRIRKDIPEDARLDARLNPMNKAAEFLFFKKKKKTKSVVFELSNYFPVALVAYLQNYFKQTIQKMTDKDLIYLKRLESKVNLKFDVDAISAIHKKKITIGDFVSHFFSVNSFEEINEIMSCLFQYDFAAEFYQFAKKDHEEKANNDWHPDKVFRLIKELFEIRHIICHEVFIPKSVTGKDVYSYQVAIFKMLEYCSEKVQDAISEK